MKYYINILLSTAVLIVVANDLLAQTKGHIFNSVVGNNSEPVLYNEVNMNTYELLTTNVQVSKIDNLQKIVFSPLKLSEKGSVSTLRETKINLAQKNGISTLGIGVGWDNSSPYSKRGDDILARIIFTTIPIQAAGEDDYDYEIRKAKIIRGNQVKYADAYKLMLENSFKFTLGYNISLFEIIGGDKVDLDQDMVIDNYNSVEGHNYSLGLTHVFSLKSALSLTTHYTKKLGSAKANEKIVDYIGGSLSFAHQIIVLNKDYEKSEDYLKTLFVPSIILGASIEYQKAVSNTSFAKDGITNALAITPSADFKINPKNQFRIGIPIKKISGFKDEASFGPFLQWTLQIAKIE